MDFLNDANLTPWLIPAGPLLAFLIITLLTNRSKLVPATDQHEYGGHHPDYEGMHGAGGQQIQPGHQRRRQYWPASFSRC